MGARKQGDDLGTAAALVGRQHELDRIERVLGGLQRGPAVVSVVGEPGIGKTRLLAELCERADGRRQLVLDGRASELERGVPFRVFVDALDDYLASRPPAELRRLGPERLAELAAVFPSLAAHGTEGRPVLQAERYRAHYAVRALLEQLAAGRPLVLALDDLHWADEASLELASHLLLRRPRAPVLIALAYRPRQAPAPLSRAMVTAAREDGFVELPLGPLGREEAALLLGDELDPETASELYVESGGNPFYLEQLARTAGGRSAARGDPDLEGPPPSVQAALEEELSWLSSAARTLAEGGAVAGEPFDIELAAVTAGLDERVALAHVDELLDLGLVSATGVPGRFRFRHPIVRCAALAATKPGWRLAAHARAATLLERRGASPFARAHHVECSAKAGDDRAVALLTEAGNAVAGRAPAAAAHWFGVALRLLPDGDGSGRRIELLVPMATALGSAGRLEESRAALHELLGLLPQEASAVRARVVAFIALIEHLVGRHGEATALLLAALEELPDRRSPEAAGLMIELALDGMYEPDFERMAGWAREAYATAVPLGDPALLATAAGALSNGEYHVGRIREAEASLSEAGRLLESLSGDALAERLDAALCAGWACQNLEHHDAGVRHLDHGLAVARETGQEHLLAPMAIGKAICMTWQGRLAQAGELADEIVESARVSLNPQSLAWSLTLRCWIATLAGDLRLALAAGEEAVALAAEQVSENYFSALSGCYLAETRLEAGAPERCRDELLAAAHGPELPVIEVPLRSHF
jgi:ATP/maltotriose-dependent transcriptional regulator MalT